MSTYKTDLMKKAAELGFTLFEDKGASLIFINEAGYKVRTSKTPSCPFAIKHILGDMRRTNKTGIARPNRAA